INKDCDDDFLRPLPPPPPNPATPTRHARLSRASPSRPMKRKSTSPTRPGSPALNGSASSASASSFLASQKKLLAKKKQKPKSLSKSQARSLSLAAALPASGEREERPQRDPRRKRPRRHRGGGCDFLDDEAALTDSDADFVSSDEASDAADSDAGSSFVDDATQQEAETSAVAATGGMRAIYLRSLATAQQSPARRFKIPSLADRSFNPAEVFSQLPRAGVPESPESEYQFDSFLVPNEQAVSPAAATAKSPLSAAIALGKRRAKAAVNNTTKSSKQQQAKQQRRRLVVIQEDTQFCADDADNSSDDFHLDLCHRDNGFLHHTRQYQQNEEAQAALVVRRGAPFRLMLKFNAELNSGINIIALTMSNESYGQEKLRRIWTLQEISSQTGDDKCPFKMNLVKSKSDSTTLCVQLSAGFDAPVSKYRITKVTLFHSPSLAVSMEANVEILLIYNPFHIDDPVFMGVDKERQEFVMEDSGMLFLRNPVTWRGPGKPWFFGQFPFIHPLFPRQFESPVLDCVLLLLSGSQLAWEEWANPVKVARALSAVINSIDEGGLLVGNWSGNYEDGRSPTTGRALGNPDPERDEFLVRSRHPRQPADRQSSTNSTGEPFRDKNSDSVWNFHVWNEMWMTRPDLGKRYNGWQAVDATPQEVSGGFFQTGPCPLLAIREGEVNVPHDANFIFSEVNACVKRYVSPRQRGGDLDRGPFRPRAVGSFERQDLTNLYKYEEGSSEEPGHLRGGPRARQAGRQRSDCLRRVSPLTVRRLPSGIVFGQDASVEVAVKNLSDRDRAGSCYCSAVLRNSAGKDLKELSVENKPLRSCQSMPGSTREFGNEEVDIVIQASLTDTENRVCRPLDHVIGILYPDLLIRHCKSRTPNPGSESIKKYRTSEIVVELKERPGVRAHRREILHRGARLEKLRFGAESR
uniref:TGc domain-containing protein n=1 Tax=Macrostomum lignano TaxID=282301 RepID=A0A1I8F7F4_9PLAT